MAHHNEDGSPRQRTFVYVDGFNFYYRAVRGGPYKWLDYLTLFRDVLRPTNDILKIQYFTARVSGKVDQGAVLRQQAYLRALATIPALHVHLGSFLAHERWARLAKSPTAHFRPIPEVVSILRVEEKGSDVNLASWLVRDGFQDEYDVAVVVSNDTDLVEPIRMVVEEIGKPVGLICPAKRPATSLARVASFCRFVTPARLAAAQFPDRIPGTTIQKPDGW